MDTFFRIMKVPAYGRTGLLRHRGGSGVSEVHTWLPVSDFGEWLGSWLRDMSAKSSVLESGLHDVSCPERRLLFCF